MAKFSRNFIAGRMNKVVDQRLLPEGEYVDAMNVRMGSTEQSEVGVIENTKGNVPLTELRYIDGTQLSIDAKCIGAIEDSANETIYWFVHDSAFPVGDTGKLDMIVSFNVFTGFLTYHVISIDDGGGVNTTLNFNDLYLITGVNVIGDFLYFTDDYNAPRYINTRRNYDNPIANIDEITAEELLVIKKPPTQSPTIDLINTAGQSNFLTERFISFAYRYRYADGEYSATSQWSDIAFIPSDFSFNTTSILNDGMTNAFNTAIVNYNSGGPLVVGIDLLFKQSNNNIIKVIEKLDKGELGLADNTIYQYTFSNSKIFTILSESELLRLYDNVPRYAQAQTIMGNRLMYGNYVEGYDLLDKNGNPTRLEYSTSLISTDIGSEEIPTSLSSGNYSIDTPVVIPDSIVNIDLNGFDLVKGASIGLTISLTHNSWTGDTPPPAQTSTNIQFGINFVLNTDYASVYDLATSIEFQQAIGTSLPSGNIKPVYSPISGVETSCNGNTSTDLLNCILPQNLSSTYKYDSGISSGGQAIKIITSPASQSIGFQFIAMRYVDDLNAPTLNYYEYYSVIFSYAEYKKISSPRSLHSNRGYQIGIVYMDEFNRSTTALVSTQNDTEHVPCGYSAKQNQIQVTIPKEQIAPSWAKRYKFVIKPDTEGYETIYSNLFFIDSGTSDLYLLLEGENTRKIEIGDKLIVKSDTDGPTQTCIYTTVLDKQAKASNFISVAGNQPVPAGVYMKLVANNFNVVTDANSIIAPGLKTKRGYWNPNHNTIVSTPVVDYPMNIADPANPGMYIDYTVPAGSKIIIDIVTRWNNEGWNGTRLYQLSVSLTSSTDYDNMYDWFIGDNIQSVLSLGSQSFTDGACSFKPSISCSSNISNIFTQTLGPVNTAWYTDYCANHYRFYRDPANNQLIFNVVAPVVSCYTPFGLAAYNYSDVRVNIKVYRSSGALIFETLPLDALPDVFYENNLSFEIDADGNHMGNIQDQDIALGIPAIVDTQFFNCFAFGNGVESYKIKDSIIGRSFNLGERVNVVAAQEYKEADRFADITYSGVYNAETNLNKLNEFNLGLLNYKNLETSFGPIYKLDGRETDVLVLQEDKISYVLAGKNLLSDSTGGGAIASVPEVLGTQIARTEKYGISFNPESYVQWGGNRYFTDVKRGAVLQLMGDSYSSDQIKVISEQNMRTWFRDMFNSSFSTQKLGGFDPYMNEYVLTTNDTPIPTNPQCLACGITQTVSISEPLTYCVDLGPIVGQTTISWSVVSYTGDDFEVSVEYATSTYSSGPVTNDGQLTFYKDSISVETAIVTITPSDGNLVLQITAECPVPEVLTIVEIVVGNNTEAGEQIHTQYRYTDGVYISPLQSNLVTFASGTANPLVSRYNVTTGYVGTGGFPPEFTVMSMQTNKIFPDDFVFNPLNDKFRYYRTNVLYPNTPANVLTVIGLSSTASPITGSSPIYKANFTVPDKTSGDVLYLIWDMRDSIPTELCYAESNVVEPKTEVCCNCSTCTTDCVNVTVTNLSSSTTATIEFGITTGGKCASSPFTIELAPEEVYETCIQVGTDYEVIEGVASVLLTECADCSTYVYVNPQGSGITATVKYFDCTTGDEVAVSVGEGDNLKFCCQFGTVPEVGPGDNDNLYATNICKCCEDNSCTQWRIYDIIDDSFVAWRNCEGSEVSELFLKDNTYYFCVETGFNPNIVYGDCTIEPYDGCFNSANC